MPDLSHLLAQGAGTPVTALDLVSVRARVRQRRRRHRAGLAALVLVPLVLGGAGVVALQDRGEQTLVPAEMTGVPDGESLGQLISVTDGDDPVLTWQPLGPCTMQGSAGVEPSCVAPPDLPPLDPRVSAPLGDPGLRLTVLSSTDQPTGAKPVDLLRAFLADPVIPAHRVHLTVAGGRVVALTDHEPALGVRSVTSVPPAPDGVSYGDLVALGDGPDPVLLWQPLAPCDDGEPVPSGASCLDPSGAQVAAPLSSGALDVVLTHQGDEQGADLVRAYLAEPAAFHRVQLSVLDGRVTSIHDDVTVREPHGATGPPS